MLDVQTCRKGVSDGAEDAGAEPDGRLQPRLSLLLCKWSGETHDGMGNGAAGCRSVCLLR